MLVWEALCSLKTGVDKGWGMPIWGKQSPSAGGMKTSRKTSIFFVTVLPGDITHNLAANARKWQEAAAAARVSSAHAHSDHKVISWHAPNFI